MNDTDNSNSGRAEGIKAIITKDQQVDRMSVGQLIQVVLGIKNQNGPIFSCFGNDNLINWYF